MDQSKTVEDRFNDLCNFHRISSSIRLVFAGQVSSRNFDGFRFEWGRQAMAGCGCFLALCVSISKSK